MQDPNWRELLRFCAARGAYRGAGSETLADILRSGGGNNGELFGLAAFDAGDNL